MSNTSKKTSQMSKEPIENAEQIIDLFGGIRPMAGKLDIAVTTVQGWKERNVIPAARRGQIEKVAKENNIDVSDFLSSAGGGAERTKSVESGPKSAQSESPSNVRPLSSVAPEKKSETQKAQQAVNTNASPSPETIIRPGGATNARPQDKRAQDKKPSSPTMDTRRQLEEMHRKSAKRNMMFTGSLVVIALIAGFVMLGGNDAERIEADLSQFERQTTSGFEQLRNETQNLTNRVNEIAGQVSGIVQTLNDESAGSILDRIASLEGQLAEIGAPEQMQALMQRVDNMAASLGGQEELGAMMQQLSQAMSGMQGDMEDMSEAVETAKADNAALTEALEGVTGRDLGAAAMLMALGHVRNSLNREETPFEEDLAVLQNVLGTQDPELNAAISRLAPYAADGVLSTETLSEELKSMTGDIIQAKAMGEDVSIQDQALQRFNDVVTLSKNGEVINTTEEDQVISKAQQLLDEGDVQGAMAELSKLEGEAAQVAQPWMEQAAGNVAAQNLEAVILEEILKQVEGLRAGGLFNSIGNSGSPFPF